MRFTLSVSIQIAAALLATRCQAYGNLYTLGNLGTSGGAGSGSHASIRFTSRVTKTVQQIRIHLGPIFTAPVCQVTLQSDSAGYPGTVLGSSLPFTPAATSWNKLPLSDTSNSQITAGQVYHIVLNYVSGSGNADFWARLNANPFYPDGTPDPAFSFLAYYSGSWHIPGATEGFVLDFSDGSFDGNGYIWSSNWSIEGADTAKVGERFVPASNVTVNELQVKFINNCPCSDSLHYTLDDATLNATIDNGIIATSSTPTGWAKAPLSHEVTLLAGHSYRLYFSSSTGNWNVNNYEVLYPIALDYGQTEIQPYASLTWGGANQGGLISYGATSGWTDWVGKDLSFNFIYNTPTITPTFTSSPTITSTPSITETFTASPTFSHSPTATPTFTITPTSTPSPLYHLSGKSRTVVAPVPLKAGAPLCVYYSKAPLKADLSVFNAAGELVASSSFDGERNACMPSKGWANGLYFVRMHLTYADGASETVLQKVPVTAP